MIFMLKMQLQEKKWLRALELFRHDADVLLLNALLGASLAWRLALSFDAKDVISAEKAAKTREKKLSS